MRFNLSFLEEADTVRHRLPDAGRVVHPVVTPEQTQGWDVLHQKDVGWNLGDLPAGETDDDDAALPWDAEMKEEGKAQEENERYFKKKTFLKTLWLESKP